MEACQGSLRHSSFLVSIVISYWSLGNFYLTYYSDIAFYGVSLNQSVILSDIGFAGGKTQFDSLHNIAVGNIIVALAVSRSFMFIPSSAKVYC
jgi:hypothetical protein